MTHICIHVVCVMPAIIRFFSRHPMANSIDISEEAGVRYLHFGSEWVQGAMRIRKPFALELAYTQEMMAGLLLRPGPPWPRRALLIGLGAGSLTKFVHRHLPGTDLTVVEIDPRVAAAARQYFRLPEEDRRFRIVIDDGADFIARADRQWDMILVDGFDRHARAGRLDTEPFYLDCRARMSRQGLMAVNLFGRSRGFKASLERLRRVFDGRALAFPSCDSGNVIAFVADGDPIRESMPELRQRATDLKDACGLNLLPTLTRVQMGVALPEETLHL